MVPPSAPRPLDPPMLASSQDHPPGIPALSLGASGRRGVSCLQCRDDASGHLDDGAHGVGHFKHGFLVLLGGTWQEVRAQ